MHSDGSFGYRVRSEKRSADSGEADCHFCGPDRANHATDPDETMGHAYGTCTGIDELWVWAAETSLLPAGVAFAATSWTSAIHNHDKGRRPLVTGVGPLILEPKERKELAQNLNAWWSLIQSSGGAARRTPFVRN